jgi:WD40 repeat protein
MKSRLLIFLFFLCTSLVRAQNNPLPNLEPITADNASRLTQLARYGNGIFQSSAAWSPDNKTLAVAGSIGVWFYDAEDWKASPQLMDLDKHVYDVAFSPDGNTLAYSTEDNMTHLVNAITHQETELFKGGNIFAFSPNGELFAVERVDYSDDCGTGYCYPSWHIDVWKLVGHQKIASIDAPPLEYGYPQEVIFSPDGKLLTISWTGIAFDTCGNTQSQVQIWNIDQLRQSSEDQTPQSDISESQYIAISPKSDLIATVVNDYYIWSPGEIRLWDIQAGKERFLLTTNDGENRGDIGSIRFNADGTKITALVHDYQNDYLMSWDTTTGERSTTEFTFPNPVNKIAFSPSGDEMIGLMSNALRVWNIGKGYEQQALVSLEQSIVNSQFAPDGSAFVYKDAEQRLHLWKMDKNGISEKGVSEVLDSEGILQWSKTGSTAVYADKNQIFIWDVITGALSKLDDSLSSDNRYTLSSDGSRLAYLATDHRLHVWDIESAHPQSIVGADFPRGANFLFNPDGTLLLTVSRIGKMERPVQVQLWNTMDGKLIRDFGKYSKERLSVQFNKDGTQIAIQTFEWIRHEHTRNTDPLYQTLIFNVETGQPLFWNQNRYSSGEFNPDWTLFMLNKGDWSSAAVEVTDVATKKPAFEAPLYSSYGGGVGGFSPDGKRMTMSEISQNNCGADERGMGLWDMITAKRIGKISLSSGYWDGGRMDYSTDSSLIVMGDKYDVTLWDARIGKYIGELPQSNIPASYITFNADGTRLITASSDGTVRMWGVPH